MKIVIDLLGVIFEIYIIILFAGLLWEKKTKSNLILLLTCVGLMVMTLLASIYLKDSIYITIVFLIEVFVISFFYNSSFLHKILFSFLMTVFFGVSEIIVGIPISIEFQVDIQHTQENVVIYFLAVLLSKFISFIIMKIASLFINGRTYIKSRSFIIKMLVYPLTSAAVILLISKFIFDSQDETMKLISFMTLILLMVSNILLFYIIEKQIKTDFIKHKLEFTGYQLQNQIAHYNELSERQVQINRTYHDIRNYLFAVLGYIQTNDYEKAENKIKELTEKVIDKSQHIHTGNVCLDALLTIKYNKIKDNEINFEQKIILPDILNIDSVDLSIIVGNILDNAIEACLRSPENSDSFIKLRMKQLKDYFIITVENTTTHAKKSTEFITVKVNKYVHGFGLQNINMLAKKYNGEMMVNAEEGVFKTQVILQNDVERCLIT